MNNRDAYRVYLMIEGLFSFFFYIIITVDMVYQVEIVKLNPLQLVLVGTVLEVTAFLCQVPTGVIADVYSRRWSVIIGILLTGIAFVVEGAIPRFEAMLIGSVLWGIGATFISGAEEAWIADEVGEEHVGHVFLRGAQVAQIGAVFGIIGSVVLASIRLNLAVIVGGSLILMLGVYLLFFMPEQGFASKTSNERTSWKTLRETFLHGGRVVRGKPILLTILSIALFYGLASEGFDRLWTAHFIANFTFPTFGILTPVIWFGIMRGCGMVLSIGGAELVRRRINTSNASMVTRLLFVLTLVQIVSVVVFGLTGNFALAVVAFLIAKNVSNQIIYPVYSAWLTHHTEAKVRATIISMMGQVDAIGQITGGPIIGVIGTLISLRVAIVATACLVAPNLLLFVRANRQGKEVMTV